MQTSCSFGHIYNSDQYAACPYCNRGTPAIYFGNNNGDKTTMPGGFGAAAAPAAPDSTVAPNFGNFAPQMDRTTAPNMGGYASMNQDIGKTEAPDFVKERMKKEENDRTVGYFEKKYGLEPVVGWLVCIEGPYRGEDFRLYGRINTIGRASSNDVVLEKEHTVSQKNHVRVAYDPKHNNFQMIPGEGHNIAYLNDAPLYVPQLLNAYDLIELGETKLLFIPLCSDKFQWKQVTP